MSSFHNKAGAKPGQFVSFKLAPQHIEKGDPYGLRQGLYIGNGQILYEGDPSAVKAERIFNIVPDKNLFESTRIFVSGWRLGV